MRVCMDLLAVGVMQAKPQNKTLQNELIKKLLPMYALGKLTGPHSSLVIPHLVQTCPQTLARGLTMMATDDPSPATTQKVVPSAASLANQGLMWQAMEVLGSFIGCTPWRLGSIQSPSEFCLTTQQGGGV